MSALLSQGYLKTPDGHEVYYAEFGNPRGMAAVVLHGGPGSSANIAMLDWFDLTRWRVVLFDQRGCGKSRPAGRLEHNTTEHLVADIERLRAQLDISEWVVVGGSWGAFLALAYAAGHACVIRHLVLRGVFLPSEPQLEWFFQQLRALMPLAWSDLTDNMTVTEKNSVLQTLANRLLGDDLTAQADAASRWGRYEDRIMAVLKQRGVGFDARADEKEKRAQGEAETDRTTVIETGHAKSAAQKLTNSDIATDLTDQEGEALASDVRRMHKFRIQSHYLQHRCFVDLPVLLRQLGDCCTGMTLIHGTHDWICPPANVYELLPYLSSSEVVWVPGGTHTTSDPLIAGALAQKLSELA